MFYSLNNPIPLQLLSQLECIYQFTCFNCITVTLWGSYLFSQPCSLYAHFDAMLFQCSYQYPIKPKLENLHVDLAAVQYINCYAFDQTLIRSEMNNSVIPILEACALTNVSYK